MSWKTTLVLVVAVCTLVASADATCSRYKTCSDCVCGSKEFGDGDSCDVSRQCGWCAATSTCYHVPVTSNSSGINCPALAGAWQVAAPDDDDDGTDVAEALCDVPLRRGALPSAILMLVLGTLMSMYTTYINCRAKNRTVDSVWLRKVAVAHVPPGETAEWQGSSENVALAQPKTKAVLVPMIIAILLVTVPTLVWVIVGLPKITQGGFGFFFPVFYVGGLGFLAYMVMALVASGPSIVYAYAISSKSVIEVTGDARKRVQKEVKMHSIDSIDYVTVTGNSVVFGGGSGSITIQHQRDTSQLFQYLQQRRAASNGLPAGAGAGGLGSTPPASLDPSGNPIKMASFGPV